MEDYLYEKQRDDAQELLQEQAEAEANFLFPEGCKCSDSDNTICDWCAVYHAYLGDT